MSTTQTYSKQPKVEIPARFTFTSGGKPTTIVHRLYGPGTNEQVFTRLQQDGLLIPTLGQHVSYALLARRNQEAPELEEVNKLMKKRYLHSGTDIHNFPGNIFFYHDITSLNERLRNPTQRELEDRLSSKESKGVIYSEDGSLRRVEGKYPVRRLEFGALGTHPYIIGMTGSEEGAEEADELASLHKVKPFLRLHKDIRDPVTTFSALYSDWLLDNCLSVYGNDRSYGWGGCAFGVQEKTGEASRA